MPPRSAGPHISLTYRHGRHSKKNPVNRYRRANSPRGITVNPRSGSITVTSAGVCRKTATKCPAFPGRITPAIDGATISPGAITATASTPLARIARAKYQISVPLAELRASTANSRSVTVLPNRRSNVAALAGPHVEGVLCKQASRSHRSRNCARSNGASNGFKCGVKSNNSAATGIATRPAGAIRACNTPASNPTPAPASSTYGIARKL